MKYRDKRTHFKFHVNLIVKANRRGKKPTIRLWRETLIIRTFHLYCSFVRRARARAVHGRTNDERQSREANAKFSARLWCGSGTSFSFLRCAKCATRAWFSRWFAILRFAFSWEGLHVVVEIFFLLWWKRK